MTKIDNEQAESNKSIEGRALIDDQPFGAMLKAAREEAGYSIERAAMATRISQPFVEALEKGHFEQLPGAVFGRGFIRNLCKAYGKDSTEILVAFDRRTNAGKGKDINPNDRDEKRHQQLKKGVLLIQPNEWKGRIKTLAPHHYLRAKPLIMLVGAVIIGAIIINQFDNEQESPDQLVQDSGAVKDSVETPAIPADQTAAAPTASAPVAPVMPSAQAPAVASNANPPAAAPAPTPATPAPAAVASSDEEQMSGGTSVELRVKAPVIVKITKDNEKQIVGELKPDIYRYRFKTQLKFYVEDSSAIEIYFNGQRVPTSSVKGEPKRISFQSSEGQIAKKASPPNL